VIADVAREANVPKSRVEREFDKLHKNGFVYTVGDGDTAEVRTP
jgi:DNA-binding IscR family transcriptional regulator